MGQYQPPHRDPAWPVMIVGGGPARGPGDADPLRHRAVPRIVLAVERHRRQMAQLLDGLDEAHRLAVTAGVSALATGQVDAATLLAHFADCLRAGDEEVDALVRHLEAYPDPSHPEQQGPTTC